MRNPTIIRPFLVTLCWSLVIINCDEIVEKIQNMGLKNDDHHSNLGNIPMAELWRRLQSDNIQLPGNVASGTTLDQCREACYANARCQSYSFCDANQLKDNECILSRFSFRSKKCLRTIRGVFEDPQMEAELDGDPAKIQTVNLKKSGSCTIYNKDYAAYFEISTIGGIEWRASDVVPVHSFDECAKLCVDLKFQSLRDDFNRAEKAMSQLKDSQLTASYKIEFFNVKDSPSPGRSCDKFLYFGNPQSMGVAETERVFSDILAKAKEVQNIGTSSSQPELKTNNLEAQGLCTMDSAKGGKKVTISREVMYRLNAKVGKFRATALYQQVPGLSLRGFELGHKEKEGLRLYNLGSEISPELRENAAKNFLQFFDQFMNHYSGEIISLESCASACANNDIKIFPVCKSFDILYYKSIDGSRLTMCRLNGITLNDAIQNNRLDLIGTEIDQHIMKRIHFEPSKIESQE